MDDFFHNPEAEAELNRKNKRRRKVTSQDHRAYVRDMMLDALRRWEGPQLSSSVEEQYSKAVNCVGALKVSPSARDIEAFYATESIGNIRLGAFLSALMNTYLGPEDTVAIRPRPWALGCDLGAMLATATLIVEGDAGLNAAHRLNGGHVVVSGSADCHYGDKMQDGRLEIGMAKGDGLDSITGGNALLHAISTKEYYTDAIAPHQLGGLVEIRCNVPLEAEGCHRLGIGYDQRRAARLQVVGDVYCPIDKGKQGGRTHVEGNVVGASIAWRKEAGETHIEGNGVRGPDGSYPAVGPEQRGGETRVTGRFEGSIAHGMGRNATVVIGKDAICEHFALGESGSGTVQVLGDVKGNIGGLSCRITCTVDGRVEGDITNLEEGADIRVKKGVTGRISGMDGGVVKVNGHIGHVGESYDGKVYLNGSDVTNIPLGNKIVTWLNRRM